MGIKKNIGKVIHEKLEKLNASPEDLVWVNIERKLKEDKKRRRVFLWWLYGGIGTAIFLLTFLMNIFSFNENPSLKTDMTKEANAINQDKTQQSPIETINPEKKKNANASQDTILDNSESIISHNNHQSPKSFTSKNRNHPPINNSNKKDSQGDEQTTNEHIINPLKNKNANNNIELMTQNTILADSTENEDQKENEKLAAFIEKEKENDKDTLKPKPTIGSKWSIFPNVSMAYNNAFKNTFTDKISYNYGLYVHYGASDKLNVRIGLNRLNLKQTWKEDSSINKQELTYTETSLEIRYLINNKKIRPYLNGGFSYYILTDARLEKNISGEIFDYKNESDFKRGPVSINLGIGIQTKIHSHFYVNMETHFKYQLKPYERTHDFNPCIITLLTGIEYKF